MPASWMWCSDVMSATTLGLCGWASPNPCAHRRTEHTHTHNDSSIRRQVKQDRKKNSPTNGKLQSGTRGRGRKRVGTNLVCCRISAMLVCFLHLVLCVEGANAGHSRSTSSKLPAACVSICCVVVKFVITAVAKPPNHIHSTSDCAEGQRHRDASPALSSLFSGREGGVHTFYVQRLRTGTEKIFST